MSYYLSSFSFANEVMTLLSSSFPKPQISEGA